MPLPQAEKRRLLETAKRVRELILRATFESGSGHLGGSLSQTDCIIALYAKYLRHNPQRPDDPERDRFVLSKGHGSLGYAAVLADQGYFPAEDLYKFGKTDSKFAMHIDRHKVAGVEASTGSLGHGFGQAVGMALGARLQEMKWRTWCLISDGECQEGSIWEAAMSVPGFKLRNFTLIVDRNRLTIDGFTEELMPIEPLHDKFSAFGWRTIRIDGHNYDAIADAYEKAIEEKDKPVAIIADTIKGYGVDFMENEVKWHYGGLDTAVYERAHKALLAKYAQWGV